MSLRGAGIVVARAEGRGESLCERVRNAGGDCLLLPVIEIRALPTPALPAGNPDWIIFTSAAAVQHGAPLLQPRLRNTTRIAAIGRATAGALEAAGIAVDLVPARMESEGLLDSPEFRSTKNLQCWIARGLGGRELLAGALAARGARVALIEVYERRLPAIATAPLLERWRQGRVNALVVASRTALINLHALLDDEGRSYLRETQLVVPTERMIKLALEFHIRPDPLVACNATDDATLACLEQWWIARQQDLQ